VNSDETKKLEENLEADLELKDEAADAVKGGDAGNAGNAGGGGNAGNAGNAGIAGKGPRIL
jgi:hypothetical protein